MQKREQIAKELAGNKTKYMEWEKQREEESCMNCRKCAWFDAGNGYNVEADCNLAYKGIRDKKTYKPIIRPPQSWCYVEEVTT